MIVGACLLIKNREGKILLQMRDNNPGVVSPLTWDFFGGACEGNETPAQGAAREMREELGIEATPEDFQEVGSLITHGIDEHLLAFGRPLEWGDFKIYEGAGAGFFNHKDIALLPLSPPVRALLEARILQ
jgi:8-oxo-dGTP pyrophosphatase MutT (NUDIX family)